MWKLLSSRRVLKTFEGKPNGKAQRRLSINTGLHVLQMVSELDTGRCASEDVGPLGGGGGLGDRPSIGERNECQQGCKALKGIGIVRSYIS